MIEIAKCLGLSPVVALAQLGDVIHAPHCSGNPGSCAKPGGGAVKTIWRRSIFLQGNRFMPGTSSLAWVLVVLGFAGPALADQPTTIPRTTTPQIRQVVDRATKYLQTESSSWLNTRKCAACHHAPVALWALNEADRQGYTIDKKYV